MKTSKRMKIATWLLLFIFPPVGILLLWWKCKDYSKKKKIILTAISLLWFGIALLSGDDSSEQPTTTENATTQTAKEVTKEESTKAKEEATTKKKNAKKEKQAFIDKCKEYNYKDILRYPDKYKGKKIKVTVKIYQKFGGGLFDGSEYYRSYTNDDYDTWMNNEFVFTDERESDDTKLLEDDIIVIYGTYDGTKKIERALTNTDDEVPIIKAKYITITNK